MAETVLEVKNLRKKYNKFLALEDLSFSVEKGQVFGLLGPNGSGKTTTLGILLGVLKSSGGSFSWFNNNDATENRKRIGSLLETPNFYPYMNAVDNLTVIAKIKGMTDFEERIDVVLKKVRLFERKKSKFRTYSLGMKQRLAIAATMLSNPDVYVLDEPTNGLDPEGIVEIRNLILDIASEGKTIIIASHILDEIERICSHVAILKRGQLLQYGTIAEITKQDRLVSLSYENINQLKLAIEHIPFCTIVEEKQDEIIVTLPDEYTTSTLNKTLVEHGIYVSGIREHRKKLESIFIDLVSA
jgi:ABC-type multidrug transport system ATPase subunit